MQANAQHEEKSKCIVIEAQAQTTKEVPGLQSGQDQIKEHKRFFIIEVDCSLQNGIEV